ncbi:MAG: FHA domain-containing protein [Magnetococcus sp. DMHC-1]|nr:FHA domain-containing protein [Magnetococcales bacterium]
MATLGYVEFLGRNGEVTSRERLTTLPCRIGRGYDMDILLDDPCVAPAHLEIIALEATGTTVRNLGSRNGVILPASKRFLLEEERLPPDTVLRIGRILLRICGADVPVNPEQTFRPGGLARWIRRPEVATVLLVTMLVGQGVLLDTRQLTSEGWNEIVSGLVNLLTITFAWGFCSIFLSRIFSGSTNLSAFVALFCLAALVYRGMEEIVGILFLSFNWRGENWAIATLEALLLGWVYYHMSSLIWRTGHKIRFDTALYIVLGRLLIVPVFDYLQEQKNHDFQIHDRFKPAMLIVTRGEDPPDFMARAREMRLRLHKEFP